RGISPLIATVLLIGFTVVVGTMVIIWGRNFVKEKAEKEGVLAEKQLKCENVEIDIKSVDKVNNNIVIENKGNEIINGFILRVVSGGSGAQKILQDMDALKTSTLTYSFTGLQDDAKIDLIPGLKPEGVNAPLVPCSNKHKIIKIE
ncbi:MAG: archaellin/type IV pilin N-terminal domain-containing protein, partial [Nanoarchaeota archaeon]